MTDIWALRQAVITRPLTRKGIIEKEKALSTAYSIKDSKFGSALLRGNTQENRLLLSEIDRLENQFRRRQMHIDQERKQFLQKPRIVPSLVVERTPTPSTIAHYEYLQDGGIEEFDGPNYMRPLRTRVKTPSSLPTLEAFVIETKQKTNVWEAPMERKQKPRFHSQVRPTTPLSKEEQSDLERGWMNHVVRPDSSGQEPSTRRRPQTTPLTTIPKEFKAAIKAMDPTLFPDSSCNSVISSDTPFVTQLDHYPEKSNKSVTFSSQVKVHKITRPSGKLDSGNDGDVGKQTSLAVAVPHRNVKSAAPKNTTKRPWDKTPTIPVRRTRSATYPWLRKHPVKTNV